MQVAESTHDEIDTTRINIATEPRELCSGPWSAVAINKSSGFGGHNVALAFMAA
jgi:hypothetical protein